MNNPGRRAHPFRAILLSLGSCLTAFACTLCVLLLAVEVRSWSVGNAGTRIAAHIATPAAPHTATISVASLEGIPSGDASTPVPSPVPPTSTPIPTAVPSPTATATLQPTNTPLPTPTLSSPGAPGNFVPHFILDRPVPPDAPTRTPERYYLYGDTQGGTYRVHHGVEFENPIDTPLIAAAPGTVDVAANDSNPICGPDHNVMCGPKAPFYGNVVILRLAASYNGQPIFLVYGHQDHIAVRQGQRVNTGDILGYEGQTGVADGPHLHFEVRIGVNDYAHTRSPLLWLKPLPGTGVLAGRVVDSQGQLVASAVADLLDASGGNEVIFTETYGHDATPPVNSDDVLGENFAFTDLPAGTYLLHISAGDQDVERTVTIGDGQLTFVEVDTK